METIRFLSKIYAPQDLEKILKSEQKKVVMTNGCFDLLHRGHVTYLYQARLLGDILVVALNTDQSIRELKGAQRPLNTLEARLTVVAALESVDYVTWFEDLTPLKLIKNLKPNFLVKGGDWLKEKIVGAQEVLSWGGEVHSIPYVEGYSTTQLLTRLSKKDGL